MATSFAPGFQTLAAAPFFGVAAGVDAAVSASRPVHGRVTPAVPGSARQGGTQTPPDGPGGPRSEWLGGLHRMRTEGLMPLNML